MSIYVTSLFDRSLKKQHISDGKLRKIAQEIIDGLYDADLGGNVYKKRIPLKQGKSGGARSVIAFRLNEHLFFIDGWMKNAVNKGGHREISDDDLATYRDIANDFLSMPAAVIKIALETGRLREVSCDEPS